MANTNTITKSDSHYNSMVAALLPIALYASVLYSSRVWLICVVAAVTARACDVRVMSLRKIPLDTRDRSSIVAAFTFALMLPVTVPLYIVVMTVAIVIVIGKHAFGGKDVYPFNLSALAMCIAAVNWPEEVFKAVRPFTAVDFWSGAARSTVTGASQIKAGGIPYISNLDLLIGDYAGAMGTSFILLIAVIGVVLIINKKITWHVPVTFIATCTIFAFLFPQMYGVSRLFSVKFEILAGSLIYAAVFMLTEPATTPKTPKAKVVFGIVSGILTMIFRYYGSYEIGVCFAILIVNATENFWDRLFDGVIFENIHRAVHSVAETAEHNIEKRVERHKEEQAERKSAAKTKIKTEKTIENAEDKPQAKNTVSAVKSTLDIIGEAEDHLDDVEFSTRTIDVDEALRRFDQKYGDKNVKIKKKTDNGEGK